MLLLLDSHDGAPPVGAHYHPSAYAKVSAGLTLALMVVLRWIVLQLSS